MASKQSENQSVSGIIRRRVRKGTRSCAECTLCRQLETSIFENKCYIVSDSMNIKTNCWEGRKRKIRCVFSPDNGIQCVECFSRGTSCVPQDMVDPPMALTRKINMRERVSRLENAVEMLRKESESMKLLFQSLKR